jgi:hypothetical protein
MKRGEEGEGGIQVQEDVRGGVHHCVSLLSQCDSVQMSECTDRVGGVAPRMQEPISQPGCDGRVRR